MTTREELRDAFALQYGMFNGNLRPDPDLLRPKHEQPLNNKTKDDLFDVVNVVYHSRLLNK